MKESLIIFTVIIAFFLGYTIVAKIIEFLKSRYRKSENKTFGDMYEKGYNIYSESINQEEKYYTEILGLKGKLSKNDIKKRYLELVKKYHPDKVEHLGEEFKKLAEIKFKKINEAYKFFSDKYNIQ